MTAADYCRQLAAPFDKADIHWKPQATSGNRAMAVAYANARAVMDRLDAVVGPTHWWDTYKVLPSGSVVCKLTIVIPGHGAVSKQDVGSQSEQPDDGDKLKAAFSDALKRAAVKFGVGRYLYRLPRQWVDWDAQKKQFIKPPTLPPWALPVPSGGRVGASPPQTATSAGVNVPAVSGAEGQESKLPEPTTGDQFLTWALNAETRLAAKGLCQPGEMLELLEKANANANLPEPKTWDAAQVKRAVEWCKQFARQCVKNSQTAA